MPDSVLDTGDRAVNKTDKNNYPSGTFSPMFQMQDIAIKKKSKLKKKLESGKGCGIK